MSIEECPHFDAFAERALIIKAVEARKAVVGICLSDAIRDITKQQSGVNQQSTR